MKKIIILLALFLISACVRSPQPISLFETEEAQSDVIGEFSTEQEDEAEEFLQEVS